MREVEFAALTDGLAAGATAAAGTAEAELAADLTRVVSAVRWSRLAGPSSPPTSPRRPVPPDSPKAPSEVAAKAGSAQPHG